MNFKPHPLSPDVKKIYEEKANDYRLLRKAVSKIYEGIHKYEGNMLGQLGHIVQFQVADIADKVNQNAESYRQLSYTLDVVKKFLYNAHSAAKESIDAYLEYERPATINGEYVCNRCQVTSVCSIDAEEVKSQTSMYHCQLCERTGTSQEILTRKEITKMNITE